jgi:hypothetical protein
VWDQKTTIRSALHGTEDTSTSGSADKAHIKERLKRAAALIPLGGLGERKLAICLFDANKVLVELEVL